MVDVGRSSTLQVWGKGFRISEGSEEFQLLVPPSSGELGDRERFLLDVEWGGVLAHLYRLDDATRVRQFYLGVQAEFISMAFVEASKDRHKRRSVVVVGATTPMEWQQVDLAWVASRSASLCRRFSRALSKTLEGAPENLQQQLKDGTFLARREFALDDEAEDEQRDWRPVCDQIRRWKGVRGVATRYLLALDANVLCGSRDELEGLTVAGLFDDSANTIIPLDAELSLWTKPVTTPHKEQPRAGEVVHQETETLRAILDEQIKMREHAERTEAYNQRTSGIMDSMHKLLAAWYDAWLTRRR